MKKILTLIITIISIFILKTISFSYANIDELDTNIHTFIINPTNLNLNNVFDNINNDVNIVSIKPINYKNINKTLYIHGYDNYNKQTNLINDYIKELEKNNLEEDALYIRRKGILIKEMKVESTIKDISNYCTINNCFYKILK